MKNEIINDSNLDNLFQSARNQEPVHSFSDTQINFVASAAVGLSSFAAAKYLGNSIFKHKFLIMTLSSITILTSAVLFFNSARVEASESFTAKNENSLFTQTGTKRNLKIKPLISNLENSSITSELSMTPLILKALIAKPIPKHDLNLAFQTLESSMVTAESDTIRVSYFVSEKTTMDELNAIKAEARKSGLNFYFFAKIKHGRIKKMNYSMTGIEKRGSKGVKINPGLTMNYFHHEITWRNDKNGKFIDFGKSSRNSVYCAARSLTDDAVNEMKSLEDNLMKNNSLNKTGKQETPLEVTPIRAIPTQILPTDIMLNRKSDGNLKQINHLINVETTEIELDEIQKEALTAGIAFKYTVAYKKTQIKTISIEMIIRSANGNMRNDIHVHRKKNESFSIPIIWRIDDTGIAKDFGNPNQFKLNIF